MVTASTMEPLYHGDQPRERPRWEKRILAQGPWDQATQPLSITGAPSLPMPVEISDKASLEPFFAHLRGDGDHSPTPIARSDKEPSHNVEILEFQKGVLYSDGRLDLCKMATGPRSIRDLMAALRTNTFVRHFLLGNNVIGPVGAKEIAAYITYRPDQIETWYLAGNCIDTDSCSLLVEAMIKSRVITNVWLKRNPLLPGSVPALYRLLIQSSKLRTLDLDQTELGDAGVAQLFSLLADHNRPIALRHMYMNATGISAAACTQISNYLEAPSCRLKSLYMSNNPIGDPVSLLAPGVQACRTLQRVSLQSCGLKSVAANELISACISHPTIRMLDVGQAYATEDLGMRFNWLDADCASTIIQLIEKTNLQYLNISYCPMPCTQMDKIYHAAAASDSLLWFSAQPLVKGGSSHEEIKAGRAALRSLKLVHERLHRNVDQKYNGMSYENFLAGPKRFLVSPHDVRYIDSVYRNRDAGLARRGLRVLDKHWNEADDTLERVQIGAVY